MAVPAENKTLLCEQCGAPLQSRAGEADCLHCLLTAGIEAKADEADPLPNESATRFYQHYEILARPDGSPWELGRGAMGVTYKARDRNLDTLVALKIINARFSARPDARQRFLREAQAAASLRHPNVASVFHFGTINALPELEGEALSAEEKAEAGDSFYAMEFIEGETLEARLRRSGPLSAVTALQIAVQVTRALIAAERRGLVHRDLKPSNIMLAAEEEETGASGATWRSLGEGDRFRAGQARARGSGAAGEVFRDPGLFQPGAAPGGGRRWTLGYLFVRHHALVFAHGEGAISLVGRWARRSRNGKGRCPSRN